MLKSVLQEINNCQNTSENDINPLYHKNEEENKNLKKEENNNPIRNTFEKLDIVSITRHYYMELSRHSV